MKSWSVRIMNKATNSMLNKTVPQGTEKYSPERIEEILIYFSTSIIHFNTEEEIAWDLVKNCISKLNFTDCVIYMVDKRTNVLVQKAAHGPKNPRNYDIEKPIDIPLGKGICGTVAVTGIPEIVNNTREDTRYILDDEVRLSEISVPIKSDGEIIGVIDCEHAEEGFFTVQHLQILKAIASFYGIRVSKLRADEKQRIDRNRVLATEKGMNKMRLAALNTQLGPHFLFNSINAIQHFIITDNKRPALDYLSLFSKLIRQFLGNINKDRISVKEESTMLEWYLQLQQLRYDPRFHYSIRINPESEALDAMIPPFLAQSLVENFLEAMISQNKGNSTISIQFEIKNEKVVLNLQVEALDNSFFTSHISEYRQGITKWSDYVETYNKIKKYKINYKIDDQWDEEKWVGKKVTLEMPNLSE